jgi:hypothetical protein
VRKVHGGLIGDSDDEDGVSAKGKKKKKNQRRSTDEDIVRSPFKVKNEILMRN